MKLVITRTVVICKILFKLPECPCFFLFSWRLVKKKLVHGPDVLFTLIIDDFTKNQKKTYFEGLDVKVRNKSVI